MRVNRHIYWFSFYNLDAISARYRGKYILDFLNVNHEVSYDFVFPSYKLLPFLLFIRVYLCALFHSKKSTLIVVQKVCTNNLYASCLKILCKLRSGKVVYDIDDAEWTRYPPQNINYFVKNAYLCTVGSSLIETYCKQFNSNTVLITSPIIDHNIRKENRSDVFTIGWVGDYSDHRKSLEQYFFNALLKIDGDMKVVLLGLRTKEEKDSVEKIFSNKSNIHFEMPLNVDWLNEEAIYRTIKTFDLGISTLSDSEFDLAKSAFKVKQYLSCGVPVLSCNKSENRKFVINNFNGYLCDNSEEFYNYIVKIKEMDASEYNLMSYNCIQNTEIFGIKSYCELFMSNTNRMM